MTILDDYPQPPDKKSLLRLALTVNSIGTLAV
jgi:hypothetical protein